MKGLDIIREGNISAVGGLILSKGALITLPVGDSLRDIGGLLSFELLLFAFIPPFDLGNLHRAALGLSRVSGYYL